MSSQCVVHIRRSGGKQLYFRWTLLLVFYAYFRLQVLFLRSRFHSVCNLFVSLDYNMQTQDQFQEIIQDHGCFPVANYCCSFWYFVTFILPWNGKEDMWCIECIKDLIYYIFFWTCFEYNAIWCRNMSTLYKQLSFHNFGSMLQILSNYNSCES